MLVEWRSRPWKRPFPPAGTTLRSSSWRYGRSCFGFATPGVPTWRSSSSWAGLPPCSRGRWPWTRRWARSRGGSWMRGAERPLARARVYLPEGGGYVRTRDDGAFLIPGVRAARRVRLTVRARGYETSYDEVRVTEGSETAGVRFRMSPRVATFDLYSSERVFRVGERPTVHVSGALVEQIVVRVYAADRDRDRRAISSPLSRKALGKRLESVLEARVRDRVDRSPRPGRGFQQFRAPSRPGPGPLPGERSGPGGEPCAPVELPGHGPGGCHPALSPRIAGVCPELLLGAACVGGAPGVPGGGADDPPGHHGAGRDLHVEGPARRGHGPRGEPGRASGLDLAGPSLGVGREQGLAGVPVHRASHLPARARGVLPRHRAAGSQPDLQRGPGSAGAGAGE